MSDIRRHPYLTQPSQAFWSRSVSQNWNTRDLIVESEPLLKRSDRIMTAGSCFAANIVPYLENAGYYYVRTERLDSDTDRFGYGRYSASYGNIYTARQLLQLLQRALGSLKPIEDRWYAGEAVIDPFRPGLPFPAESDDEFDLLQASHLEKVREAVGGTDIFIFTLGLTEAWISKRDGAVFPTCPGTIAGRFDPDMHQFVNFSVVETVADLRAAFVLLRQISPSIRIILTVSPVPLVATATEDHIYTANAYSKSVLRAAAGEICRSEQMVRYFPAYEIVTGPHSDGFFESDLRNVSAAGICCVLDTLLANSERPLVEARAVAMDLSQLMSHKLGQVECEEMMNDPSL